jgi:hypothetical protein
MLKCNVDAAIFREQNCFGVGMCLRDDKGNFIGAYEIMTCTFFIDTNLYDMYVVLLSIESHPQS